ncbi:MAG: family 1 encapsulin nanocompartment shell protein [Minwuia sp.]|uniref:family 1 encapsulin nanocompartment shell protein n=1 Tax=Minwuia sp. TaxID=2493630 RepID=UPI003A8789B2
MDNLKRRLAPIPDAAWTEIEETAVTTLNAVLAARRVVDFKGPLGYDRDAVSTGRIRKLSEPVFEGVRSASRIVLPMVEMRVDFDLSIEELDDLARGAEDADMDPVVEAARTIAMAEDRLVFHGYEAGGIEGLTEACGTAPALPDDPSDWPEIIASALDRMRAEGVQGPFALVVPPDAYTRLQAAVSSTGRRVMDHVVKLLDGEVVPCRAIDGAAVLSRRGGDFELYVGRDFAIGYSSHDAERVRLYVEETLSFRAVGDEAAIALAG